MGEMAEYYGAESPETFDAFAKECEQQDLARAYSAGYWVTKEKQRIRPRRMGDQHLINTLRLLQRNGETRRIATLKMVLFLPGPTGDMASLAFDSACDDATNSTWRDYVPVIFDDLEDEADRRNLQWNEIQDEGTWMLSHELAMLEARQR